jgi:hypothetical protein
MNNEPLTYFDVTAAEPSFSPENLTIGDFMGALLALILLCLVIWGYFKETD